MREWELGSGRWRCSDNGDEFGGGDIRSVEDAAILAAASYKSITAPKYFPLLFDLLPTK